MIRNPYEMILFFVILNFGIGYFLTRRLIIRTYKQTAEMLATVHKQTMDTIITWPHIDIDITSVLDEIKESGKQTRLSIDRSTQSALKVISGDEGI